MKIKKGKYLHFKGHIIEIICLARHTETEEEMVVYMEERLDNPKGRYWVRPGKMFLEKVIVDGKKVPRFTYIDA